MCLMYNLNVLIVIFTLYFDIENGQKSSQKYYDENNKDIGLFKMFCNGFLAITNYPDHSIEIWRRNVEWSFLNRCDTMQSTSSILCELSIKVFWAWQKYILQLRD